MPAWIAWLSAPLVFAGAAQLAMITLAGTASLWAVITAVLVINTRHVMYSAALAPTFRRQPRWMRWVGPSFMVDQTFALAAAADASLPRRLPSLLPHGGAHPVRRVEHRRPARDAGRTDRPGLVAARFRAAGDVRRPHAVRDQARPGRGRRDRRRVRVARHRRPPRPSRHRDRSGRRGRSPAPSPSRSSSAVCRVRRRRGERTMSTIAALVALACAALGTYFARSGLILAARRPGPPRTGRARPAERRSRGARRTDDQPRRRR